LARDVEVTTWSLEMLSPADHRPPSRSLVDLDLRQAREPCPELNRFLYTAVGAGWYWVDRLPWTYADWLRYLDRPELETWVAHVSGTPAGYFELEEQPDSTIELAYFGLLPRFTGRGLGSALLSASIRRSWERVQRRVWVHTCSLDHPRALENYLARGFRLFRTETAVKRLPDESPGPWPGA
jgi:GNAT superfamily N-acetyltransferase